MSRSTRACCRAARQALTSWPAATARSRRRRPFRRAPEPTRRPWRGALRRPIRIRFSATWSLLTTERRRSAPRRPDPAAPARSSAVSGALTYNPGAGIPTGNGSRTVELWVKTTSTSFQTMVQWGDNRNFGTNFYVQLVGDELYFNLNNPTNPNINAPYTLANGQWHFVVVTFNGSVLTAVVDGTSV